jgi:hypothetical protein
LLELDWVNRKHHGGGLAFGPDGYLYLGLRDGGGVHRVPDIYVAPPGDADDLNRHIEETPEDPFRIPERFHHYDRYAQDLNLLYGKILRIDVDAGQSSYAIPPTNPTLGEDAEGGLYLLTTPTASWSARPARSGNWCPPTPADAPSGGGSSDQSGVRCCWRHRVLLS